MLFSACVVPLVAWALLGGGYFFLFFRFAPSPGWFFGPFFCSMTLVFIWGSLRQILFGSEQLTALKRAENREAPQDGKLFAAIGTIRPLREALTSPIFGEKCVAYDYEVSRTVHHRSNGKSHTTEKKYFTGFALTPSIIQTATGDVKLLGFSLLEKFKRYGANSIEADPEPYKRIEEYVQKTKPETLTGSKAVKAFSAFEEIFADDDGSIKVDWAPEDLDVPFSELELQEHLILPSTQLTAFGLYDAAKRGIVPKKDRRKMVIELYPGGAAEARRMLKSKTITSLIFSLFTFTLAHGLSLLALRNEITHSVQDHLNEHPGVNEYIEKYWPQNLSR